MRPSITFAFSPRTSIDAASDPALSDRDGLPQEFADRAWTEDMGVADPSDWPLEQMWLHPDREALIDHRDDVQECLLARLAELPPRLQAGPMGCATPRNVRDFLADQQPDRAWRLASRLYLQAGALGLAGLEGQVAVDLATSAALLAGEHHGCVLGAVEAITLIGRVAERAETMALDYPGLGLTAVPLAVRLRHRRQSVVERLAQAIHIDGGSVWSVEALMWRAPVLVPAASPSGSPRP